jgi:hypothetical protein
MPAMRAALISLVLFPVLLPGCGGNSDQAMAERKSALAERVVVVNDMPNLQLCLGQLSAALLKKPGDTDISFNCAAGTYRGLTPEGRLCELKVDSDAGTFRFRVGEDAVSIKWDTSAHTAQGRPMHNLEDASAPPKRGIQLTQFTGGAVPVTEAMILRVGTGKPALPELTYLRTADGAIQSVPCVFGK